MESTPTRYYKPDLEAYFEQRRAEIDQRIPLVAVAYAAKLQPPLTNEDIEPYFSEFKSLYQDMINKGNDSIQTNNLEVNRGKSDEQTEIDVARLQQELASAKDEQLIKDGNAPVPKPPYQPIRSYLAWAAVGTLSLFEGIVNRPSFSAWGYNLLEALCMSVAFAGLLAVFAHSFLRIIRAAKTAWQQRCVAGALSASLVALFWYLADVRARHLSVLVAEDTGDATASFSPVPFVLLSTLLFAAAVLVCYFFLPNREQRAAMLDYRQGLRETAARASNIGRLEQEIRAKTEANLEMNRVHNSLQEYGAMLEQRIMTYAAHSLQLWQKHNALARSDGRPKSFDAECQLKFKTFFHHVNLM